MASSKQDTDKEVITAKFKAKMQECLSIVEGAKEGEINTADKAEFAAKSKELFSLATEYFTKAGVSSEIIALIDPEKILSEGGPAEFKQKISELVTEKRNTINRLLSKLSDTKTDDKLSPDKKDTLLLIQTEELKKTRKELGALLGGATQMAGDSGSLKKKAIVAATTIVGNLGGVSSALIWASACTFAGAVILSPLAGIGAFFGANIGLTFSLPGAIYMVEHGATSAEYARNNQLQASLDKVLNQLITIADPSRAKVADSVKKAAKPSMPQLKSFMSGGSKESLVVKNATPKPNPTESNRSPNKEKPH